MKQSRNKAEFEVETFNLHNSTLDLTRPPTQGPSLGEGCLKLLWPQFLVLFVLYNNFEGPIPQLGHLPARPPELKQVACTQVTKELV